MHEAQRYHLSPERLYADCWTRAFLRDRVDPAEAHDTCNVGIGWGQWDDWLGYWLDGHGTLVSIDIDGDVARRLAERQAHDAHPNPARAVHADLLRADLGQHDLVTVVGTTLHETHAPTRALDCARQAVRDGGLLYVTVMHGLGDPDRLLADQSGIVHRQTFTELADAALTLALIRVRHRA